VSAKKNTVIYEFNSVDFTNKLFNKKNMILIGITRKTLMSLVLPFVNFLSTIKLTSYVHILKIRNDLFLGDNQVDKHLFK